MAMDIYRTILKRRSIRSFQQRKISTKELKRLVNAARVAPSAANMQPLEYFVVTNPDLAKDIFRHLKWAGYIAPKGTPGPDSEPVAYIVILINKNKVAHPMIKRDETAIRYSFKADLRDVGAAAQSIMLLARSKGIGSCWLGAINKQGIRRALAVPKHLDVDSVIALGYPKMVSRVTRFSGSVKYHLNKSGVLHVPKRPVKDIIHIDKF